MNLNYKIMLFCIFLLIIPISFSLTTDYETTSVARIVGNSPAGMKQQLDKETLDLKHATYVNGLSYHFNKKSGIISSIFGNGFDLNPNKFNFKSNELFVFEGNGLVKDDISVNLGYNKLDIPELKNKFRDSSPLFVLDASHAGLSLPRKGSISRELSPNSIMVASNSYPSKEMVRAFVCNLRTFRDLGETFRQARNNYYWGVDAEDEFVGLSMLSYALYGDPNVGVNMPSDFSDKSLKSFCNNYLEDYSLNYNIMNLGSAFKSTYTFRINDFKINDTGAFDLIQTDTAEQNYFNELLVLPRQIITVDFPLKTVIQNVSLIEFADPVDIIADIPTWMNGSFTNRECFANTLNASFSYSHSFTEDSETVLVDVIPVDVLDCEAGKFRLYKKVKYFVDYIPYSPVIIDAIDSLPSFAPNSDAEVFVKVRSIKSESVFGQIVIKDEENIIGQVNQELFAQETKDIPISIKVPDKSGPLRLSVEFYENEESKTRSDFFIYISPLNFEISIPEKLNLSNNLVANVILKNNLNTLPINITMLLTDSQDTEISRYSQIEELSTALTVKPIVFDTTKNPGYYKLKTFITFDNQKYISEKVFLIARTDKEFSPVLKPIQDLVIKQGEKITLRPKAEDLNGDYLRYGISKPFNENLNWQTGKHHVGEFNIKVNVSDDKYTDNKEFKVIIDDNNVVNEFSDKSKENSFVYFGKGNHTLKLKLLKKSKPKFALLKMRGTS